MLAFPTITTLYVFILRNVQHLNRPSDIHICIVYVLFFESGCGYPTVDDICNILRHLFDDFVCQCRFCKFAQRSFECFVFAFLFQLQELQEYFVSSTVPLAFFSGGHLGHKAVEPKILRTSAQGTSRHIFGNANLFYETVETSHVCLMTHDDGMVNCA